MSYADRNLLYWRRNLAVCVFGSFTTLVSLSLLLPFLPLYVQQLGVTSQAAVVQWSAVAFGATFFGTALTAPIWGRLADRYGRKPMLVRAAIGMAVVMSMIGLARDVTDLVVLRLIAGLIGGYASASIVMIGSQVPKEKAGWALGVLSTGALSGNLIGPLVGGFLPEFVGIRGTFFVGGAMIAVAAITTILLIREDFDRASDGARRHRGTRIERGSSRWPVIAALLSTAMMVLLANMSIEPIITVYIGHLGVALDDQARIAGVIMACSALGSILTAARLGALADRVGSWNVIIGCLLLTGAVHGAPGVCHPMVATGDSARAHGHDHCRTAAGDCQADPPFSGGAQHRQSPRLSSIGAIFGAGDRAFDRWPGRCALWIAHPVFLVTGALLVFCAGINGWVKYRFQSEALRFTKNDRQIHN